MISITFKCISVNLLVNVARTAIQQSDIDLVHLEILLTKGRIDVGLTSGRNSTLGLT